MSAKPELHSGSAQGELQTTESSQPMLRRETTRPEDSGDGHAVRFVGGGSASGQVRDEYHGVDACASANPLSVQQGCPLPAGNGGKANYPGIDSFDCLFGKEAVPNDVDWKDLCRQASIEPDPEKVFELAKRIIELLDKKNEQPGRKKSC